MAHLIPAPRPIPTREDRMTHARTGPSFATYLDAQERDQLNARAATAEAERDRAREYAADNDAVLEAVHAALDRAGYQSAVHGPANGIALLAAERDKARAELARVRQQRDRLVVDLTDAGNEVDQLTVDRDRARAELGRAQEVIATIRDAVERIDRALAAYDTTPGETCPTAPVPSRRAQEEPARPAAAAALPSTTEEILAWLSRHGLSTTPGVGVVLAAVRRDVLGVCSACGPVTP